MRRGEVEARRFPLNTEFRIARGAKREAAVVEVRLINAAGQIGRGEATPYARYGERVESVVEALRNTAFDDLPSGAARNAYDCAALDLQAKEEGKPVHALLGLPAPSSATTAVTLSLSTPENMAKAAEPLAKLPFLKLKLAGDGADEDRLKAVADAAPKAQLILDGNEGFSPQSFETLIPSLLSLNIALVEQPLPQGQDEALAPFKGLVPLCADESAHTGADIPALQAHYDWVNIKLDKAGGLTPALTMAKAAKAANMKIMVGCMVASSLAMAPALLLQSYADILDLDGPLFLAKDREDGLVYDGATLSPGTLRGYP